MTTDELSNYQRNKSSKYSHQTDASSRPPHLARLPESEIFSSSHDNYQMLFRPTPVAVAQRRRGAGIPQQIYGVADALARILQFLLHDDRIYLKRIEYNYILPLANPLYRSAIHHHIISTAQTSKYMLHGGVGDNLLPVMLAKHWRNRSGPRYVVSRLHFCRTCNGHRRFDSKELQGTHE